MLCRATELTFCHATCENNTVNIRPVTSDAFAAELYIATDRHPESAVDNPLYNAATLTGLERKNDFDYEEQTSFASVYRRRFPCARLGFVHET